MPGNKHHPPKRSVGDVAHAGARAALSLIPIAGAPAAELLSLVVSPPLERRRDTWMEEVGSALRGLEEKNGLDLSSLSTNDGFIDAVLHATQVALRTSHEEKRQALRNAVLNSALPSPPELALQLMFLTFVDEFTEWHLRMIRLFQDPSAWALQNSHTFPSLSAGSLSRILESAYPQLRDNRPFYDQVWRDVYQRGITSTDGLHTMMTGHGLLEKRLTSLGTRFVQFIEDPTSDGDA